MASANLIFLANWHGQYGLQSVLDGRADGWMDLDRALQYLWWSIKIEPSNAMVSRVACGLAHAIVSPHQDYVDWLAKRMLKSIDDNAFLTWEYSSFGVFMLHLWALHSGSTLPNIDRPNVAKLGVYKKVIDAWSDDKQLAEGISELCDYHLEQTRESLPLPEFIHIPYYLFPVEVLAIARIRSNLGLPMPVISHPLLSTPLAIAPAVAAVPLLQEDATLYELVLKAKQSGILQ